MKEILCSNLSQVDNTRAMTFSFKTLKQKYNKEGTLSTKEKIVTGHRKSAISTAVFEAHSSA
jgi:hypothetical protein